MNRPNWIRRNWKWLVPIILLLGVFVMSLPKGIGNATLHIVKGYTDTEVPENALEIVKKNERVRQILGKLEPIGKLTVLEGYVKYAKNADSVFMALTIKGSKGKGKMDVRAFMKNGQWEYEQLDVRLKEPHFRKETIPIALPQKSVLTPN